MTTSYEIEPVEAVERSLEPDFKRDQKRTPLPKLQLFITFLIQLAEPITGTVIYPFVNQFVGNTGITGGDERKTGYYAGLIESVFFIGEAATVMHWGRASDYLGRKPILLIGPLGLTITTLFFGLSRSFWMLVVWRCLQGVFNGNIGVSKTLMAEITDSTNMADAYALMLVMWGVGATLGPIMGGVLADPAERWPTLFGSVFFDRYPYFLPCAAAALVAFLSFLISSIVLKETLPLAIRRRQRKSQNQSSAAQQRLLGNSNEPSYGATTQNDPELNDQEDSKLDNNIPPPLATLMTSKMMTSLGVYALIAFVDMCGQVLQPLVYFTSPTYGGLGFSPYEIGLIMGIWGFVNGVAQALFAGPIIRRIGAKGTVIGSLITYLLGFVTFPMIRYFARKAGGVDPMTWVVLIIQLALALGRYIAYTAIQIIIIRNVPARNSLGTTNGLAQAIGSLMRGIAPSVASSLFSMSLEKQLMGGDMAFLALTLITALSVRLAFAL